MSSYNINTGNQLITTGKPLVMGILNATPDSFFEGSRCMTENLIENRIKQIIDEGGSIIDIGAYSSRPDAQHIDTKEEWRRLETALRILRDQYPDVITSVDTFRSEIAKRAVEEYGVNMINDISGGEMDRSMFATIGELKVPYIMMHMKGTPQTMQQHCDYNDLFQDIALYFSGKIEQLRELGVNDIIIDPGFGFSKTLEQNYELLAKLEHFSIFEHPILVGVSRKSMIYKLLDIKPEEALNGTSVIHTVALRKGADILRVHDVKEAVQCVEITEMIKRY
ncbi:MAG: dihydropteroate synthase [Bacteroidales bacterium]